MKSLSKEIHQLINSNIEKIVQAPIIDSLGKEIGWNTKFLTDNGGILGGGINQNKDTSLKIALSETIEILEIKYILSISEIQNYKLDLIPTRCGIAVGYKNKETQLRSIAEGLERWIWSQWIDHKHQMSQCDISINQLSTLASNYFIFFDKVYFFKKIFSIVINNTPLTFIFGASIGIKDGGAFPGSRVGLINDDLWTHSLIESYRHYHIFKNLTQRKDQNQNIIDRINYFGTHSNEALDQALFTRSKYVWAEPTLDLHINIRQGENGYFMYRTLFKDYIPWHLGDYRRFIF